MANSNIQSLYLDYVVYLTTVLNNTQSSDDDKEGRTDGNNGNVRLTMFLRHQH